MCNFKSIQRPSSDFHLSTAEKHILWQMTGLFKGKEERNIFFSTSEGKSVGITGRHRNYDLHSTIWINCLIDDLKGCVTFV